MPQFPIRQQSRRRLRFALAAGVGAGLCLQLWVPKWVFKPVFKHEKATRGAKEGWEGVSFLGGDISASPLASRLGCGTEREAPIPPKLLQLQVSSARSGGACPRGAPRDTLGAGRGAADIRGVWGGPKHPPRSLAWPRCSVSSRRVGPRGFRGGAGGPPRRGWETPAGGGGVLGVTCEALTTRRLPCIRAAYVRLEGRRVAKRHPFLLVLGIWGGSLHPGFILSVLRVYLATARC